MHTEYKKIVGRWIMEPFSFASSEALELPVSIRMYVFQLGDVCQANISSVSAWKESRHQYHSLL